MEFPQIGRQCSQNHCNQLNFLPLECKCGKVFCSEHFNLHSSTCPIDGNIDKEPVTLNKITDVHRCSHAGCNDTSIVPLICQRCQQHFCVKHRHLTRCYDEDPEVLAREKERYAAPVRQFNEAKNVIDEQIRKNLDEASKKGKNRGMANKIKLMKLKGKAVGDKAVPSVNRVYFNVGKPKGEEVAVFVSKTWTIGRVIDAVATECKLQNKNNVSGEKKLRIFKRDGGILTKNLADVLETLVKDGIVVDGEDLIIEYVDDNCEHL